MSDEIKKLEEKIAHLAKQRDANHLEHLADIQRVEKAIESLQKQLSELIRKTS